MRNLTTVIATLALMLTVTVDAQNPASSSAPPDRTRTTQESDDPAGRFFRRTTQKTETPAAPGALRTRSNVKVDVTISDQIGNGPVERKAVSVIAAEESWGKIRTQAVARMSDGGYLPVALNVDARPFLTASGAIQLELTVAYNPLGSTTKDTTQMRPTELNQSMTIVMQNGKPMVVSQAADPIMDRKIVVEVVAAILK